MPRITISVISPESALDGEILNFDVAATLTLAELKGFVQAETNVQPASQHFYLNNSPILGDTKTLEEAGLKDGDMLAMLARHPEAAQQPLPNRPRQPQYSDEQEIERTRLQILGNPSALAQVREQRPALHEVINDGQRFREAWMAMMRENNDREQERLEQMRILNEDPFNVEAQWKIEEMIRQETVQENLQYAYENNPEVFARVTMLYVPVIVNGHPVKAFVDSGAQTTIMSPSCAKTCGIMRLIDLRYSGVAKGVGTARILGRVHSAEITIGNATMPGSFTVMEGKDVDLLLGLDMLKRFQAVIDLKRNKLVFGPGNEVDFLGEADIPKYMEEAMESEPTVSGPNGTEIGAQSGTVKPAGTSAQASSSSHAGRSFSGQGRTLGNSSGKAPERNTNGPLHAPTPAVPGGAPAQSSYPKESVDSLVSLGFSQQQAIAALDACGGNVEYAAGLLFQS